MALLGGAGIGAAVMYLLDPESGADRRRTARDTAGRALETTSDALSTAYESAAEYVAPAWESVKHGAHNLGHGAHDAAASATSSVASMAPSSRDVRRWRRNVSSYVPSFGPRHRSHDLSPTTAGLGAAGALLLGVGAMWLFDPARGRGRRAWLMQKSTRCLHETGDFMAATGRHIRNRVRGYVHEAGSLVKRERPGDLQLAERVRSELGRMGFSGSSIGIRADNGTVILSGRCVTDDVDRILGGVRSVHGVSGIRNEMQVGNMYGSISTEPSTSPSTGNVSA